MNARSSRCFRKLRPLLALASSALLLTGCGAQSKLAHFADGDDTRLAVRLPVACEAFLVKVPVPKVGAKTDARVAFTRTADALDDANDRIGAAGDCSRDQRQDYAGQDYAGKENP